MKKQIMLGVGALLAMNTAIAFAGPAKCGEDRKITRDELGSYDVFQCRDEAYLSSESIRLEDQALARAEERLQKFDQECQALGGVITETHRSRGTERRDYEDSCELWGTGVIKHHCGCP